jgi:hypothetical protein
MDNFILKNNSHDQTLFIWYMYPTMSTILYLWPLDCHERDQGHKWNKSGALIYTSAYIALSHEAFYSSDISVSMWGSFGITNACIKSRNICKRVHSG